MVENHLKFGFCKVAKIYMRRWTKHIAKHMWFPLLSSILVTGEDGRVRILTKLAISIRIYWVLQESTQSLEFSISENELLATLCVGSPIS